MISWFFETNMAQISQNSYLNTALYYRSLQSGMHKTTHWGAVKILEFLFVLSFYLKKRKLYLALLYLVNCHRRSHILDD